MTDAIWSDGDLTAKLDENQIGIRQAFRDFKGRIFVGNCSRRLGKSHLGLTMGLETCLAKAGAQVKFACPTAKQARNIIRPLMRALLLDCPEDLQPKFHAQDGIWEFPNESTLTVAGCDGGHADNLRGQGADLAIADEAGFISDLREVIEDVLLPQCLTTNGRVMLLSTPPVSPAHAFKTFADKAVENGGYVHRTIYHNPRITPELIREWQEQCGGADSPTWRREYLAEFIVDPKLAVIPEFTESKEQLLCVPVDRPTYADRYVAVHLDYTNTTGILFGFWDYSTRSLVIQDELLLERPDSASTATAMVAREISLWGAAVLPYMRVSTGDPAFLSDFGRSTGIYFFSGLEEKPDTAANVVRLDVSRDGLKVHPACRRLRAELRSAIWNKARTGPEESEGFDEYPMLRALMSLCRNVRRLRDPVPKGRPTPNQYHRPTEETREMSPNVKALQGLTRRKDRR